MLTLLLVLTSSVRRSNVSRTCRPRHSKGPWPDSSQHRPPRTHHTGEAPAGSALPQTTRTAVAVEEKRMENGVTPSLKKLKWGEKKTLWSCRCIIFNHQCVRFKYLRPPFIHRFHKHRDLMTHGWNFVLHCAETATCSGSSGIILSSSLSGYNPNFMISCLKYVRLAGYM